MKTAIIYDKWLSGLGGGEVVACTIARTLADEGFEVIFVSQDSVSLTKIKEKLDIDLSDVTFKQVESEESLRSFALDQRLSSVDLFVNISFMDYSYAIGKWNIYYVHFPSTIRSGLFNYVLQFFRFIKKFIPSAIDQRLSTNFLYEKLNDRLRAGVYPDMVKRLNSYDTFICHSEFVKGWIKKMWNKNAIVIYPPVKLLTANGQRPTTKLNWIASVGRFFTLGHGKKQEILIEAFKELYSVLSTNDPRLTTDLQLHLVGGVGTEPSSIRYIEQLKEMAKGYPIFFHLNVDRKEVEDVLLKSKIYWHAGGYGETNPINMEHFGIAAVEAISAGCIPVLYNGGGLPEIVNTLYKADTRKYLFKNQDNLVSNTLLHLLSNNIQSVAVSNLFDSENFKLSFLSIIHEKYF